MWMQPKDPKAASMLAKSKTQRGARSATRSNSILNQMNDIPVVTDTEVEGKHYINIGPSATSAIGKALWLQAPVQVQTVFGTIRSLKSVMDYMKTKEYPQEFLRKNKFTRDDHARIKRGKENQVNPENFWAVVAYLVICRVVQDPKLVNMLKNMNNNMIFTSFNAKKDQGMLNSEVTTKEYNFGLGRYLSIVRQIVDAIKDGRFEPDFARQFIRDAKDAPELDLFVGVAFEVPAELTEELVMKDLTPDLHDTDAGIEDGIDGVSVSDSTDPTWVSGGDGLPDEDELDRESAALEETAE